jgi:CDP-glucose 4,6-dehydratase|tara:strand:+ start:57 stop:1133 length:1077 start_codon:yes stop_codon:yes gene_type:complete
MKNNNNLHFWKNKKVFITGHTGFKGSWLCIILNLLGAEITGYSLKPKTIPSLFKLAGVEKIIKKSIISDIRNYENLYKQIKLSKAKIIFHLAAQPLVRQSYMEPKETFETNFLGTLNILECVKKIKSIKSSVFITSDKVYDTKKNKIYKETDFLRGTDPYSGSKVVCEHLFFSYNNSFFANNSQQKLATVRAGNVIGGGDYSKDRLIPDLMSQTKKNKKIILRNPNSTRPWQHVLEPLSGYLILAEKLYKRNKKICNQEQNWNFGPNVSNCKPVKYIANFIAKRTSLKFETVKSKSKTYIPETNFLRLSNSKSKRFLFWFPKWTLDTTLIKIIEWNKLIKLRKTRTVCEKQIKEYYKI